MDAEQDVLVGLQQLLSLGAASGLVVVVWYVLFPCFINSWSPLCLLGTSSNFLVLRIKAYKTIRVSPALWRPASSGKEGLRKWLLSYYSFLWFLRCIYS